MSMRSGITEKTLKDFGFKFEKWEDRCRHCGGGHYYSSKTETHELKAKIYPNGRFNIIWFKGKDSRYPEMRNITPANPSEFAIICNLMGYEK